MAVPVAPVVAEDPFKRYSGSVQFGMMTVPLEWKIARANLEDPEHTAIVGEIRELRQQVKVMQPGPERRRVLDDLLDAVARRRARLLVLKENEASIAFAVMTLLETWKYPEFQDRPARHTGLVADFPGTEQGGTIYCDGVAAAAGDGGAAAGLDAFKAKNECEARELKAFMIVEAIADKGGVEGMELCAAAEAAAGGSYVELLRCMSDESMRAALAASAASASSPSRASTRGKKGATKPEPAARRAAPATGVCCRECRNGKPCGDACIPFNRTCHKGPGCAC